MYGIALSAAACLRAGTRADVVWLVEADGFAVEDWSEAVMFTPGGGRVGALAGGRFDSALEDMAGRWEAGRLVDVEIDDLGALIAGTAEGASARCLVVPADTLPAEVWDLAGARMPFCLVTTLDDDVVTSFDVYTKETIGEAGEAIEQRFAASSGSTMPDESGIVSVFNALPELVVVGRSPVVDAMTDIAATLGWKIQVVTDAGSANGVIAGLSRADKVVVAAHDLDLAGPALLAALESDAGYIGSVGSRRMQENRADWLGYQGVSDLSRISGPAGLDIGAETPAEIAVSVLAEAISVKHSGD